MFVTAHNPLTGKGLLHMQSYLRSFAIALIVLAGALLTGCETPSKTEATKPATTPTSTTTPGTATPATPSAPPPTEVVRRPAELAVAEGVDLFNQGQFASSIKKLQDSPEIWTDAQPLQIEALKYLAFAHCVNNRRVPCRQNFDKLLALDPAFELTAAEAGHPQWGPVFKQAKQARSAVLTPATPARVTPTPSKP
jgi:hypothetical protein